MVTKTRSDQMYQGNIHSGVKYPPYYVGDKIYESITYDQNGLKRPWSPCYHWRIIREPVEYWYNSTYAAYYSFGDPDFSRATSFFRNKVASDLSEPRFAFQRNNNLRLIQLITSWDETLALFTVKFIKNLINPFSTHLSIEFGFKQIISDVESLIHTWYDLRNNIAIELATAKIAFRVEKVIEHENTEMDPRGFVSHSYVGKTKYYGFMSVQDELPSEPNIAIILDELGINNFIVEAWAILPFTFIFDFLTNSFIPKLLSHLTQWMPSTWFNPIWVFQGWVSHEFVGSSAAVTSVGINPTYSKYKVFDRYKTLFTPQSNMPELVWRTDLDEFRFILGSILGNIVVSRSSSVTRQNPVDNLHPEVKSALHKFIG